MEKEASLLLQNFDFFLFLVFNFSEFMYSHAIQSLILSMKVEAVIGGNNLQESNIYAYATDCFVTPSEDGADVAHRYDLLVNS